MALRWDLKPLFKNADPDTSAGQWTRRSAISAGIATVAFIIGTWRMEIWTFVIVAVAVIAAFDAGDMRVPFEDDEAVRPVWLYDENGEIREHWTNAADVADNER